MNRLFSAITISGIFLGATLCAQADGKIPERKENQQRRIARGVRSGELTPRETAGIERKESALNKEVRAERTLHGGRLSPAERRQVNRQQNRLSRSIQRNKHDAARQ